MNYYAARQHSITEKWAYTCRNGGDIWPIGRCAEDGGHATAEEAAACYRQHLIEGATWGVKLDRSERCRVSGCLEPSFEAAMCGGAAYFLCEEHMDEDYLEKVYPSVGTAVSVD